MTTIQLRSPKTTGSTAADGDFCETYGIGRDWPKFPKLQGKTNFGPKFPNFSPKLFSVINFPENIFSYRILRNFRISHKNHFLPRFPRKTCFSTEFCETSEFPEISEKCVSEPKFTCLSNVGLKIRRAAYIYNARIHPSSRHHRAACHSRACFVWPVCTCVWQAIVARPFHSETTNA